MKKKQKKKKRKRNKKEKDGWRGRGGAPLWVDVLCWHFWLSCDYSRHHTRHVVDFPSDSIFMYLESRSFLIKTLALGSTHVRWHWSDLPEAMGSGASAGTRILSSDHDYIGEVDWNYLDLPGIYVEHNLTWLPVLIKRTAIVRQLMPPLQLFSRERSLHVTLVGILWGCQNRIIAFWHCRIVLFGLGHQFRGSPQNQFGFNASSSKRANGISGKFFESTALNLIALDADRAGAHSWAMTHFWVSNSFCR